MINIHASQHSFSNIRHFALNLATIFLLSLPLSTLFTQGDPCFRGITTHPDAPVNPECEDKVNSFDWRTPRYEVPTLIMPDGSISSPYWNTSSILLNFLTNRNTSTYHDFFPEDGWELLSVLDNESFSQGNREIVHLVMYNKYESYIRFFRLFGTHIINQPYVYLFLQQDYTTTGLLHPVAGISQAMDRPSLDNYSQVAINPYHWGSYTYFDIPVEYDPCTCARPSSSNLAFHFGWAGGQILTSFDATTGDNVANLVLTGPGSPNRFPVGLLSGYANSGIAGASIYENWETMTEHYQEQGGKTPQYQPYPALWSDVSNLIRQTELSPGHDLLRKGRLHESVDIRASAGSFESLLGRMSLLGFGLRNAEIGSDPGRLRTGSIVLSHRDMIYGGTFSSAYFDLLLSKSNPGRLPTRCDYTSYPLYNEVLGRMAVLQTPRVEVQLHEQHKPLPTSPSINTNGFHAYNQGVRFNLDTENLEYTFNPAAGVDEASTTIYGALRITSYETKFGYRSSNTTTIDEQQTMFITPFLPISCLGDYNALLTSQIQPEALPHFKVELVLFVQYVFQNGKKAFQQYTYPATLVPASPVILNDVENIHEIGTPIDYNASYEIECPSLLPVTPGRIAAFCNSNQYRANRTRDRFDEDFLFVPPLSDAPTVPQQTRNWTARIYPNPATTAHAFIDFELDSQDEFTIQLLDVSGRTIHALLNRTVIDKGHFQLRIPLDGLPSGTYFVHIVTPNMTETLRFIR